MFLGVSAQPRLQSSSSCVWLFTGTLWLGCVCVLLRKMAAKAGAVPLVIGSLRLPNTQPNEFRRPDTLKPNFFAVPAQITRAFFVEQLGRREVVLANVFGTGFHTCT